MRFLCFVLLSMILVSVGESQTTPVARDIDWSKSTPGALEMAFDWADAVAREADVVDEGEVVYAPREAESKTLMRKLQRKIMWDDPDETPADAAIYAAVVDFSMKVKTCRITREFSDRTGCSIGDLSNSRRVAVTKLKEIQKSTKIEREVP